MLKMRRKVGRKAAQCINGVAIFWLALSLCACKTWYKQGADADELDIEQRNCEVSTGTDSGTAFDDCMAETGWHATTMSATSVEPGDVDDETEPFNGVQAPNADSNDVVPGSDAAATEQPQPLRKTDSLSRTPNVRPETERPPAASWFQLGMDTDDLAQDQAACNAAAGDTAFVERCLRNLGWQPVDVRMSTE